MSTLKLWWARPYRPVQVMIWTLLVAVLATIVPAAGSTLTAAPAASTSTSMAASTLSGGVAAATGGGDTGTVPAAALTDGDPGASAPIELLPAWRWSANTNLPARLAVYDLSSEGIGAIADAQFAISAFIWRLLLNVAHYSASTDVVQTVATSINGYFASTFKGLLGSGLIAIMAVAAVVMAASRVTKGRTGEAVRMIVSALLVLGVLQSLGTAASADTGATDASSIPKGTPAWLAVKGDGFVNTIADKLASAGGAVSGLTSTVRSGAAGPSDASTGGTTCAYYVGRLYSTYNAKEPDKGTAATLSMFSFMWQRAFYDPWTQAAFGDSTEGARLSCHLLEQNANVSADAQSRIAGTKAVADSPYAGMGTGPFSTQSDDGAAQQVNLAWALCKNSTEARDGWSSVSNVNNDGKGVCGRWYTSAPDSVNTAMGSALNWNKSAALNRDTIGQGDQLAIVHTVVSSYWGHDDSTRFTAGAAALAATAMYAYQFGLPSIGVLLAQFVLASLLMLLPWTLLLLALPSKKGGRNTTGVRMMKLTAMGFGTKLIYLTLFGVTLTVNSLLYSFTMSPAAAAPAGQSAAGAVSAGGSTLWSLLVPALTILIVRMVLKGLGLGNLMGMSGIAGFATAAVSGTKPNFTNGAQFMRNAKAPSSNAFERKTKSLATRGMKFAKSDIAARRAAHLLTPRKKDGTQRLDEDLSRKLAAGTLSPWQARTTQLLRNHGGGAGRTKLPDDLADRVQRGEITLGAARRLAKARDASVLATQKQRADQRAAVDGNPLASLAALASGSGQAGDGAGVPLIGTGGHISREEILADTAPARSAADLAARRAIESGADPAAAWQLAQVENLGQNLEMLTASTVPGASSMFLDPVAAAASLTAVKSSVHESLRPNVVGGILAAPALVRPTYTADGAVSIPAAMRADADLAIEALSNPLNLLDPAIVTKVTGESDAQWHTRMTATLLETGLMSPTGQTVDVLAELGIDTQTDAGRQEVLRIAIDPSALTAARVSLDTAGTARVDAAIATIAEGMRAHSDRAPEAVVHAVATAQAQIDDVRSAQHSLTEARSALDVAIPDLKLTNRLRGEVLKVAEQQAEPLMASLLAKKAELDFRVHTADGTISDDERRALTTAAAAAQAQVEDFRAKLARATAALIQTEPDRCKNELIRLIDLVNGDLNDSVAALSATAGTAEENAIKVMQRTWGTPPATGPGRRQHDVPPS